MEMFIGAFRLDDSADRRTRSACDGDVCGVRTTGELFLAFL